MPARTAHPNYRAFLASRWAPRAQRLAVRAVIGTPLLYPFDLLLTRGLAAPPSPALVAGIRLPSLVFPLLGWLAVSAKGDPVAFYGLQLPLLIGPDKGLSRSLKEVHEAIGTAGYFLIGLHAAAALLHHSVLRDNTLVRRLPAPR